MMQSVTRIRVRLKSNGYDVIVARGLLRQAGRAVRRLLPGPDSRVIVVTSSNVRRHWGAELERSLHKAKLSFHVLEMNDGEPAKRLETVEQLDRKSVV